jgi:hypothetical protein
VGAGRGASALSLTVKSASRSTCDARAGECDPPPRWLGTKVSPLRRHHRSARGSLVPKVAGNRLRRVNVSDHWVDTVVTRDIILTRFRRTAIVLVLLALLTPMAPPAAVALPSKSTWLADVDQAMSGSHRYVDRRVAAGGSRLAVNFDIDNTSLASHYDHGQPVKRVLRFAKHARQHGVGLLFNTARLRGDGRLLRAKRQLERAGYRVAGICGRRAGEGLARSKQRCRKHFVSKGYTLIANVGNRDTDFVGGDYEKAFKLPNYNNQLS